MRRFVVRPVPLLWAYLGLIAVAELLTTLEQHQLGIILHALLLCILTYEGALASLPEVRKLALALTLVPLMRVVSLSFPLASLPQLAWYPIVGLPLFASTGMIVRHLGLAVSDLGLRCNDVALQILLMSIGLPLGVVGYALTQPQAWPIPSWQSLSLSILVFIIFTGLGEELVFRGLIQFLAIPVFGRWTLVYISLLFAALHIGHQSVTYAIFVFSISLLFAHLVYWSGSIVGVTIAHGVTNITLFLIMPRVDRLPVGPYHRLLSYAIGIQAVLVGAAIARLIWRAGHAGKLFINTPSLASRPAISRAPRPRRLPESYRRFQHSDDAAGALTAPSPRVIPAPAATRRASSLRLRPGRALTGLARRYSVRPARPTYAFAILLLTWELVVLTTGRYAIPGLWATLGMERLMQMSGAVLFCTASGAIISRLVEVLVRMVNDTRAGASSLVHRQSQLVLPTIALLVAGLALGTFLVPMIQDAVDRRQSFALTLVALFCMSNGALAFWIVSTPPSRGSRRLQKRLRTPTDHG